MVEKYGAQTIDFRTPSYYTNDKQWGNWAGAGNHSQRNKLKQIPSSLWGGLQIPILNHMTQRRS